MPADPDELDAIAATVADIYREAETALVRLIARQLAGDMDAPAWATAKLAAVGSLRRGAMAILAALAADSSRALREVAVAAYRNGWTSVQDELGEKWFPKSGLGTAARKAADEIPGFGFVEALAQAVHRDIGDRSANVLRDVVDAYRSVITAATGRVVTGTQTRRQAAQSAWRALTNRGITTFVDRRGRRWQLSSYVEMATRTVTQRAAVAGQTDRLDTLDVHLVTVSNAPRECPLCRPYEGKILRTDPGPTGRVAVRHQLTDKPLTVHIEATLAEARARGFQHPNCRHSVSAYLPGVSTLPKRDTTADPDGYKAQQRQRLLERNIRAAKLAEAGALDEDMAKVARRDVAAAQAKLRDHLNANPDLKRLRYREQIGAGNIPRPGNTDAAGAIGPAVQPTLDRSTAAPVRRLPRETPTEQSANTARPTPGQADLLDEPRRAADALVSGRRKPADLTDTELRLADQEFAERAALLSKPGQLSRTHRAVRNEIKRRTQA